MKHLRPAALHAEVRIVLGHVWFAFVQVESCHLVGRPTSCDPTMAQGILRHASVEIRLELYAQTVSEEAIAAQGRYLKALDHNLGLDAREGGKCCRIKNCGRVAQSVEHRTFNARVAGSIPAALTKSASYLKGARTSYSAETHPDHWKPTMHALIEILSSIHTPMMDILNCLRSL